MITKILIYIVDMWYWLIVVDDVNKLEEQQYWNI